MSEVELKFTVDKDLGAAVWDRVVELGYAAAEPPAVQLESTYYDTPSLALQRASISLRLRRDGEAWTQTVKCDRQFRAGLSRASEFEAPRPEGSIDLSAVPDVKIRKRIEARIGGEPLEPACWTLFNRRADLLTLSDGTVAELALDVGLISAGAHSVDFCEVEVELKSGSVRSLYGLAGELFPDGGVRFSRISKADRGYLLAREGVIEPKPVPRKAKAVDLSPDEPLRLALHETLRECIDQIALNIPVVTGTRDPEGPHQLRIGLRRLRSLLVVFTPILADAHLRRLGADARWLFSEAGKLRDIEAVVTDTIVPLADDNPAEPGFARLTEALARQADGRRAKLRALLADGRTLSFILDLSLLAETIAEEASEAEGGAALLDAPLADFAREALDRRWHKAKKKAGDVDALGIEGRHELRKELKKLRYTAEFLAPLYRKKRVAAFLRHLKDIQAVLGDVMDADIAARLIADSGLYDDPDPALQRAIGWVLGSGRARARLGWDHAGELWHRLKDDRLFWR